MSDDKERIALKEILSTLDKHCPTGGMSEDISFQKWKVRGHIVNFVHLYCGVKNFFDQEKHNEE